MTDLLQGHADHERDGLCGVENFAGWYFSDILLSCLFTQTTGKRLCRHVRACVCTSTSLFLLPILNLTPLRRVDSILISHFILDLQRIPSSFKDGSQYSPSFVLSCDDAAEKSNPTMTSVFADYGVTLTHPRSIFEEDRNDGRETV